MSNEPYIPAGWRLGQPLLRFILRLIMRLDVRGLEHLPEVGPAIITANHTSWFDVLLIPAFCHVPPVTLAADKWARVPIVNWLMRYFGQAIFVNRGAVDRHALKAALAVLEEGRVLGLAPEGTRSHNGVLQKGHDGAAWLAGRTDALLVPLAMWGHEDVTGSLLRLRRPLVHLHVSEPYRLPSAARQARSRDLPQYTEQIMRHIAVMLPPEQRGPYV